MFSQTQRKLWGGIEIGEGLALKDSGKKYDSSTDGSHTMKSFSAVIGYYLNPQLSLGVNIGSTNFSRIDLSSISLSFDVRYHPLENDPNLVLMGNARYSLFTNEKNLDSRFSSDIAIGYKLFNIKNVKFTPAIGYDFCTYYMNHTNAPNQVDVKSTFCKHSLFLKLSITY